MSDDNGAPNGARKYMNVFAVLERKDSNKPAYWMKIGVAFPNRDGSLTLLMDAFPTGTNKLQVRESKPLDEQRNGNGYAHRVAYAGEVQP